MAERIVMKGFTHEQAGIWQCNKWELSKDIRSIVKHHHAPLLDGKYSYEVNIMSLADSISSFYYEGLLSMNTKFIFNKM